MNITLTNFKCHISRTFTLPETGINLIHGFNGAGKSTIFKAILFAFYGKAIRPFSHGTKTCKVELSSEKLGSNISRTRSPNRLTVKYKGKMYEDEAAQGVIDGILNVTYDKFRISSYFVQRKGQSLFC